MRGMCRSFDHIGNWMQSIKQHNTSDDLQVVLVGNKADLVAERVVTQEQAQSLADSFGIRQFGPVPQPAPPPTTLLRCGSANAPGRAGLRLTRELLRWRRVFRVLGQDRGQRRRRLPQPGPVREPRCTAERQPLPSRACAVSTAIGMPPPSFFPFGICPHLSAAR